MSTKVKGEVIKEGSIPLSALDNAISEAIPYVKYYSTEPIVINIKKGVTEYNLSRYLNFGTHFKFNNTIYPIENKHNFNTNLNGPSITGRFEDREATYLILSPSPIADQTVLLYPDVSYNKIKKEFLPDDIGGADWNAQGGEAGYIENKPFGIYNKGNCFFGDNLWEIYSENIGLYVKQNEYNGVTLDHEINSIYVFGYNNKKVEFWVNGAAIISVHYGNGFPYVVDDEGMFEDQETLNEFCNACLGICNINEIENVYLPNTVIKTSPQTLSNTDKNQALANLGIDPVVWKYMMNPYGITEGQPIPEDLANIIYNYDDVGFLPIIKNVCYIIDTSDNLYYEYIIHVSTADDYIYTMTGSKVVYEYEYNYETRVFTATD